MNLIDQFPIVLLTLASEGIDACFVDAFEDEKG
jgi:hypothetical protein